MYKLVFRGELVEGAVRADVIAQLALLLKQPPARIEQLLFSGTERVVKRVDNAALASKWQNAFAKAGAVLTIEEEAVVEPSPPVNDSLSVSRTLQPDSSVQSGSPIQTDSPEHSDAPPPSQKTAAPKRNWRKWIVAGVGCLLVIVASATIVWQQGYLNRWLFSSLSDEEKTLLTALADPQLLAIARVNIELMRKLDPSSANTEHLQNLPGVDTDVWSSLERSGIHIPQQATQLYVVAFAADEMEVAVVARGNFSPAKITQWLDEQYGTEKQDNDGLWFALLDKTTCAKGKPMLAQFSQGQLLIGSPAAVKRIAQRLKNSATAAVDITLWQNALSGKLFSLAVFSPARWQTDKAGMVQYTLGKLAADMAPVTEVYVDVEPDVVAQGMNVHVSLISNDPKYIGETHALLQTKLSDTRQKVEQDWPEVIAIYDRLQLSHSSKQLLVSIRFDQNIKEEITTWFRSLFSFSAAVDQAATAQQEVIDENPATFAPARSEQLTPFAPNDDFMDAIYKTTTGPFGIGVEALTLKNERVQIKLGVKAYDLPNLGGESSPAFLVITDVVDQQGNSLLSVPECGEKDQRLPEEVKHSYAINRIQDGKIVRGRSLTGEKIIELPVGVSIGQVARINGYIDYHLPVSVDTKIVDAPLAGATVDLHGTRIRFKSASANALSFEYSGKTGQLLQVNALNAESKPLSSNSAMRSSLFFGSGKSASLDFKGAVAKAEVIVASAIEKQRYDFELTRITPPGKEFFMEKQFPVRMGEQEFSQLGRAPAPVIKEFPFYSPKTTVSEAPVLLAINDVRASNSFGLAIEGAVYTDIVLPLYAHIGIAQLYVSKVQNASSQLHSINKSVPLYFERQGGMTINGVYKPDEKTPWLRSDFSLRAEELRVDNINYLYGELRFFQPTSVQTESVPFTLGSVWSGAKSSLQLDQWQSGRLIFSVQGAHEEIVGLKAFNHDGELISQPPQYSAVFGEPQLIVPISELPARLDIDVAINSEELIVPFELAIP